MRPFLSVIAVSLSSFACVPAFGQSATIDNLGWITIARPSTVAHAVSDDGSVVAGYSSASDNRIHVVRWTSAGGLQDLGNAAPGISGRTGIALGVSADGNVLVGYSHVDSTSAHRAIRIAGGIQSLGSLAGSSSSDNSYAYDCSADGNIVVGQTDVNATHSHAFRWQNNVMADLGTIGGAVGNCSAYACSADGGVAVGFSWNGAHNHACRFLVGSPAADLGTIDDVDGTSGALGVSANGKIAVGYSRVASGHAHAMRWTQATGMQDLGTVDDVVGFSYAYAISGDGKSIGGNSQNASRPGGTAAVWIDGEPRQLYDLLTNDYGLELPGWTSFDNVEAISHDGRTLVGYGTGWGGAAAAFRVTLSPNSRPTVDAPRPVRVECDGGRTRVTLSATVRDADLADRLTVRWLVDGVQKKVQRNVAGGARVSFTFAYPDGESVVQIRATDGAAGAADSTTVNVVDTTDPIVIVAADITRRVDAGKKFATIRLKKPSVTDVCDPNPRVTNNAPNRFPIGVTRVRWIVRDDAGNVASAVQKVTVVNRTPQASAGADVATATSKQRVRVTLDGRSSRDADGHALSYRWSAAGATIAGPTAAKTSGLFPIGRTTVRLTVTDAAGDSSTDSMIVEVRRRRSVRAAAAVADSSLDESYVNAHTSFSASGGDPDASAGLESAACARFLGILAGDEFDASTASRDEVVEYAALRVRQSQTAHRAAEQFLESYRTSGDLNAFAASMYAHAAGSYAIADLASTDRVHLTLPFDDELRR